MEFVGRYFEISQVSSFIFGPRGTGKSTWLKSSLVSARFIDLLDPTVFRRLVAQPNRLRDYLVTSQSPSTIVIDEVQRVPELLTVVHSILEEPNSPVFIMTGSSARKLRRNNVDLLGGRAVIKHFHPFMLSENKVLNLQTVLQIGSVPLIVAAGAPIEALNAYITSYINEEVQTEALTRNIENFYRFLEAISYSHASLLNKTNVARECQVSRKVVESYVNILYDLLLAFQLPIFTKRAKRAVVAHSKFYLFDAGVFRVLRPSGPLDRPHEIDGAGLEGLVAQNLRAWTDYRNERTKLYFWRTQAGTEVDFVLYGNSEFYAIEVKNSDRIESKDVRGLKTFQKDYPEASTILLYRSQVPLSVSGVTCLPVEEFLKKLTPDRTLSEVRLECILNNS
ncbi:MAG: DUF4143 domain-containing protein [Gammaproteobacteria bacterium]|nr:DUF4143 domain-containing protein [Gammaproteobacteria bacterium]MDE0252624.1 DUF4143 domain-containing protein [Gammaproteobacteria bacterium]MDE0403510.1 DUF4143 domain-containing protein [Gammaproteobacteria bacterium]